MIVSNTSRIFFTTLLLTSLAVQGVCWCAHADSASMQALEAAASSKGSCCMTTPAKEEESSEGLCEVAFGPLESQGGHCCGHCSLSNQLDAGPLAADAIVPLGPDAPVVAVAVPDAIAETTSVAGILLADRTGPFSAPASYILYASFRC